MSDAFWQTVSTFEREADWLSKQQAKASAEMQTTCIQASDVIAKSRDLMRKVDAVLARDPWRERPDRAPMRPLS